MHVSVLAGLPVTSSAYSEDKSRITAPFLQLCRVGSWRRPSATDSRVCSCRTAEAFVIALGRVQQAVGSGSALNLCLGAPVPSRGSARAFDRGLLIFSQKQTAVTRNAYLALQRVTEPVMGTPVDRMYMC